MALVRKALVFFCWLLLGLDGLFVDEFQEIVDSGKDS